MYVHTYINTYVCIYIHIGDVALVYMGRGPNVTQMYDSYESERAADMVNRAGVCILIDLIGYTSDHRQDVLALRPAPLQMHYHGYMGSTGAAYIDYYMGDRTIVPPEHARHGFTEALVLLPESFLGPSHRLSPSSLFLPPTPSSLLPPPLPNPSALLALFATKFQDTDHTRLSRETPSVTVSVTV